MFKSFFDPEGPFATAVNRIGTLILLNVLWLLCSVPVFTLGASTTALYTVLLRILAGEESHVTRQFFKAFGENFQRATGIWMILLAAMGLFFFDLYYAGCTGSFWWRLLAVFGLQIVAMELTFVFPLLARYENNWRAHMRNAAVLAVTHLPKMLLIWLIWAVPVAGCIWISEVFYALLGVWLLIGFAGLSYVTALFIKPIFDQMENSGKKP